MFGPSLKVGGNRGKTVDINRMLKLVMILSVVMGNKMPVYATFRTSFSHLTLGVKFVSFFVSLVFFSQLHVYIQIMLYIIYMSVRFMLLL